MAGRTLAPVFLAAAALFPATALAADGPECPFGKGECVDSNQACGVDPTWAPNTIRFNICGGGDDKNPDQEWDMCYVNGHTYCKPSSPPEVARRKAAREAASAKQAERDREKAAHEAAVAAEIERLGAHRADEARRLVEMREKAKAAMPKRRAPEQDCEVKRKAGLLGTGIIYSSASEAEGVLRSTEGRKQCPMGLYSLTSAPKCESVDARPTEAQKRLAKKIGLTLRDGAVRWGCSANFQCANSEKVCAPRSSSASAQ